MTNQDEASHHRAFSFAAIMRVPALLALCLALMACVQSPGLATHTAVAAVVPEPEPDIGALSAIEMPGPGAVRGMVVQRVVETSGGGRRMQGFALQSPIYAADGKPETSDGIFVGTYTNTTMWSRAGLVEPAVGDELILKGNPAFFGGRPSLSSPNVVRVVRHQVDLDREVPPFDANPPADAAEATNYWAAHHAMRCRVPAGAIVQGAHSGDGGAPNSFITLLRGDHPNAARQDPYARRVFRDAHPLDDIPERLADNGNGFRLTLVFAGDAMPSVRTFDRLAKDIEGVVLWTGGGYAIHPSAPPVFEHGEAPDRNGPPPVTRTRAQLRLATFNIENLYDFRDDPFDEKDFFAPTDGGSNVEARLENYVPASEEIYRLRLQGLAAQIVQDLELPDVIMVQEAEDQDIGYMRDGALSIETVNNRDGRLDDLQELAAEIVRMGGPLYLSATDRAGADERGIICAFLYRQDRVRLAEVPPGHPLLSGAPHTSFASDTLAYQYAASNPRALNGLSPRVGIVAPRAVQVACFERTVGADIGFPPGQKLYVLNNHFKSGPGEYVTNRIEQARLTAAIAKAIMHAEPDAWVAAGGDLNTFPRPDDANPQDPADQLGALYEAGLANLYDTQLQRHPASAYSYVFQGQAQTLDQLFVSTNLLSHLVEVRPLHINSDYSPDPSIPNRRVSDHDPVLAVFHVE